MSHFDAFMLKLTELQEKERAGAGQITEAEQKTLDYMREKLVDWASDGENSY